MASNGSKSVAATSYDTLKFSWWEVSQSVTANTTTIGWKMELIAGQFGRIWATAQSPWEIVVNGTTYTGKENIGISNNATKTLASGETVISHKTDGSQSFEFSFSQVFNITFDSTWVGTISGSGSGTLNTIPRATTPTVSNDNVSMGSLIRINTPRASSRFTHNLDYSFAGGAWVSIKDGVGTYYDWTTPDLATQIPNNTSGTLTIRCITKDGTTTVGTKTTTMTLRVNDSVVPEIVSVTVEEATDGIAAQFGQFVKSKSKLKITIEAEGAKGSTIKSYYSTVDGRSYSESSFTTAQVLSSSNLTLVVTVSDSRGRKAEQSVDIVALGYSTPTISSLQVYRVDENGAEDQDGTRIAVRYAYTVQPLQSKNTANMVVEYKQTTASTWTQLMTGNALSADTTALPVDAVFSTDYQYDVRMTLTDWFGESDTWTVQLQSGAVILDISADGEGLGIGTTAQRPGLEVGWLAMMSGGYRPIPLVDGVDFDTLTIPNIYVGRAGGGYVNCPYAGLPFTLEVLPAGTDGELSQKLTTCYTHNKLEYTRYFVEGDWGTWSHIRDSTWASLTPVSPFQTYPSTAAPRYRRTSGVVEVKGVVTPTKTITNADGWVTIATLPENYRPGGSLEVNCVCQGGGTALWLLRVTTGGAVQFARYQQGGVAADVDAGVRLPFSVTFLTDR